MIPERVARFVEDSGADGFEELALAAFAWQLERVEPYRRLCAARGATPESVADWRQVPPVPAAAFKTLELAAAPAVEVFRSSGTSAGPEARSVHRHPFPELYRRTIDAAFPRFCLPAPPPVAMLSLVAPRAQAPDSSLAFMVDHVLARWGAPESAVAVGPRGVEAARARSWAGARQRDRRPVLVLGTSLAHLQWLDALERQDLRFRLPAGSAVFDTGGFKGRGREIAPGELSARLADRLAVPPDRVVREYGMTELTSQLYTRALAGGDPDLFVAPHWVRVRVLDPETLAEAPPGRPGLVAVFDLANLGSALHLLTEDLGAVEGEGLRLLGRAGGAELRGCSLAAEALGG
ncbi:MAG TPA: acyl-protein synthetase [Thermoanaerobaculia bacterium]|nr:acyl-protein synthetase [Thermoanaerobaculia bacterium]